MATEELEVTIEIHCIQLPGTQWGDRGPVYLGIQKGDELAEPGPANLERIVFRPALRVRRHADGSANFLGPFAHGPRPERFIYLIWATAGAMLGRVKVHLNHITWTQVEKAIARKRPIKVTIPLTNAKGKPVFASVRANTAQWEF
jgi:Family of unknown function (DUF5990)